MKKPFFARFLEAQELENVSAGGPPAVKPTKKSEDTVQTMKYPSDTDEAPWEEI